MTNEEIAALGRKYVMNTYGRLPLALVRGKGARVWDADGREYLDFVGGLAVNSLGHCHPKVTAAIQKQAAQLIHCSNLYWIEPQVKLARLLVENSCLDKVFFANSGAEANEGAIKLARKYAKKRYGPHKYEIITMDRSFHGRTLAALTATGQEKFHQGYEPLPAGFKYVPFNDIEALEKAVGENTCAVMLEPIQGEGGVCEAAPQYLAQVQELCREKGLLLILDEVQCGLGRTGKLFAYEHYGVQPHIMTLAKALGGGVAIGALLAQEEVAAAFQPGDHASTFGGNPLATAAGIAALETILKDGVLENVVRVGNYFQQKLKEIQAKYPFVKEVRGRGLILGLELTIPGAEIVEKCLAAGLLINCTQQRVLRFLPPLIISEKEVDEAVDILDQAMAQGEIKAGA